MSRTPPMWSDENRARYDRSRLRYPSDLTDAEWAHVEPLIPPAKRGGNRRHVEVREVVNGLMYVLSTGCQWRAIPRDLPPRSTLYDYFDLWGWDGTLERIHEALYVKCREAAAREASPTAGIIDSQSVKSAEKGGSASTLRATTRAIRSDSPPSTSCCENYVITNEVSGLTLRLNAGEPCRHPDRQEACLNHKALALLCLASIRFTLRNICNHK
jgi:transposase